MLKDIWRREKLMERLFVYHNICTVQCCVVWLMPFVSLGRQIHNFVVKLISRTLLT